MSKKKINTERLSEASNMLKGVFYKGAAIALEYAFIEMHAAFDELLCGNNDEASQHFDKAMTISDKFVGRVALLEYPELANPGETTFSREKYLEKMACLKGDANGVD